MILYPYKDFNILNGVISKVFILELLIEEEKAIVTDYMNI
jgi:hypothetical protein